MGGIRHIAPPIFAEGIRDELHAENACPNMSVPGLDVLDQAVHYTRGVIFGHKAKGQGDRLRRLPVTRLPAGGIVSAFGFVVEKGVELLLQVSGQLSVISDVFTASEQRCKIAHDPEILIEIGIVINKSPLRRSVSVGGDPVPKRPARFGQQRRFFAGLPPL